MSNTPLPAQVGVAIGPDGRFTTIWYRAFVAIWNAINGGLGSGEVSGWAVPGDPPQGWLRTDGSAVSRDTYRALFAVIGTTYGAGDGLTTFNLPNWSVGGVDQIIRT